MSVKELVSKVGADTIGAALGGIVLKIAQELLNSEFVNILLDRLVSFSGHQGEAFVLSLIFGFVTGAILVIVIIRMDFTEKLLFEWTFESS